MKPARDPADIIPQLEALHGRALEMDRLHAAAVAAANPAHRESARNLLHYLALRQSDIRELQSGLAAWGLSRLGRCEAHVLPSIEAVLAALRSLAGNAPGRAAQAAAEIDRGGALLAAHTADLLGAAPARRSARIMVTMPTEAAHDPQVVRDLLAAGMDIMRINCAHDDLAAWSAMIANLRSAERALGRSCRVYADLAGPKLRTGAIEPVGRLMQFGPERDARGNVVSPARLRVIARGQAAPDPEQADSLPVDDALLARARPGDALEVWDNRGRFRALTLTAQCDDHWTAECAVSVYLEDGAACRLRRNRRAIAQGQVGPLPEVVLPIRLRPGDSLLLTTEKRRGGPARIGRNGRVLAPARIPCTLPEVFAALAPGHRIWFDDGKIGGIVRSTERDRATIEITQAAADGSRLRAEKGINLPDTDIDVPALTAKDLADLRAMAGQVDIVGLSFVRRAQDVLSLQQRLAELGAEGVGTVFKIETRQAFESLPRILLEGLRHARAGVMVARGDLAVEIGFERLAEVQEEILWLCEAAHVPVIWATQVLETMAKKGMPSRAEVSDAAMSVRAECVMLNKGPHIVLTTRFLAGVLERMSAHVVKRRPMLRRLAVSNLQPAKTTARRRRSG
jgi:pyruvate kinase